MSRNMTTDGKLKARTVRCALEVSRLMSELAVSTREECGEDLSSLAYRAEQAALEVRNAALCVPGVRIAVFADGEEGGDK